jgi:CubicO group peptidase (beta-lactamase class C family)
VIERRRHRRAAGLSALLALSSLTASGQRAGVAERIDALFAACQEPGAPSASVMVIQEGKITYKKAFGLANIEERVSAATHTNYRLASVTKQFTAMAAMMLADRGKLGFDQKLTAFFDDLPAWSSKVSVRHLLNHTSGVPAYEPTVQHIRPEEVTPANQLLDKDVLAILKKQNTTYFEPGAEFRYSNSGYALLALIIEKVSGMSYAQFLERNIFGPLEMTGTVAHQEGVSTVRNRAYGYLKEGGGFLRRDQSATSAVLGDGGIYSSVEDLGKWDRALTEGKLVKAETWQQAVTPGTLADGRRTAYGFGWEVGTFDEKPAWRHSGGTIGFTTHILRLPEHRVTVIVLQNRMDLNAGKAASQIAEIVLGAGAAAGAKAR